MNLQNYPLLFPPDNPKVPNLEVLDTESMQLPAGNPAPAYGPPGGPYGGYTGYGFNSFTGQPYTPQQQGEPHPHPLPLAQSQNMNHALSHTQHCKGVAAHGADMNGKHSDITASWAQD